MTELTLSKSALPAHIQALQQGNSANEWGTGQSSGFPVISIKGSKFHIRRGDESKLVTTDGETPAISMPVVIICHNRCWRLGMTHFVQNMTDVDTNFRIVENTMCFCFRCGRDNSTNCFAFD